jgi:hypothetical protein
MVGKGYVLVRQDEMAAKQPELAAIAAEKTRRDAAAAAAPPPLTPPRRATAVKPQSPLPASTAYQIQNRSASFRLRATALPPKGDMSGTFAPERISPVRREIFLATRLKILCSDM